MHCVGKRDAVLAVGEQPPTVVLRILPLLGSRSMGAAGMTDDSVVQEHIDRIHRTAVAASAYAERAARAARRSLGGRRGPDRAGPIKQMRGSEAPRPCLSLPYGSKFGRDPADVADNRMERVSTSNATGEGAPAVDRVRSRPTSKSQAHRQE